MKGFLCAGLLAILSAAPVARAYEADIHYSTTYVLARAAGWPQADALTIASANQGVDENPDTVAALEVEAAPAPSSTRYSMSSLRQAEKNLKFHCFSKTREQGERISADVRKVMAGHFAAVGEQDADPRRNSRRLIALGVALHCLQDAHSHVGFGGSCGAHPGSCHGHTYQTLLDQMVFGVLKRHYYNPDHPGVADPRRLRESLQATLLELVARRSRVGSRPVAATELITLSDELHRSGLDLPDEVRRECNRLVAGKWLFDFFHSRGAAQRGSDASEKLAPEVAGTCRNAALGSATVIRIPAPRFPRLRPDGSAYLVHANGNYQVVRGGDVEAFPRIHADQGAVAMANYANVKVRLQLSHWRQFLALPLMTRATTVSTSAPFAPSP